MAKRFTHRHTTVDELRRGLSRIDMSHKAFARAFGVNQDTVTDWAYGRRDVPPWVAVVLDLLTLPNALGLARQVAAEMIIKDNLTGEENPFLEPEPAERSRQQ